MYGITYQILEFLIILEKKSFKTFAISLLLFLISVVSTSVIFSLGTILFDSNGFITFKNCLLWHTFSTMLLGWVLYLTIEFIICTELHIRFSNVQILDIIRVLICGTWWYVFPNLTYNTILPLSPFLSRRKGALKPFIKNWLIGLIGKLHKNLLWLSVTYLCYL